MYTPIYMYYIQSTPVQDSHTNHRKQSSIFENPGDFLSKLSENQLLMWWLKQCNGIYSLLFRYIILLYITMPISQELFMFMMVQKVDEITVHFSKNLIKQTGRQTDRKTFQRRYQNKSCSECQQDVKKSVRQADKQEDRQRTSQTETDRRTVCQNDRIAGQLKSPLLLFCINQFALFLFWGCFCTIPILTD